MLDIIQQLEGRREKARLGGGETRIAAQHAKGKLTARERIDALLDPTAYVGLSPALAHRMATGGRAMATRLRSTLDA